MCSETDFTQEISHFHPNTRIPNSSFYCCLGDADPFGWSFATSKRAWKMYFWDPSQWDKMYFECPLIKYQWKKDKNFHICLRSGPTGLTCKHWLFSEFTHAVKAQDLCYYMVLPRTCHKGALQKLHSRFCPLRGYLKFSLAELVGTPPLNRKSLCSKKLSRKGGIPPP